VWVLDTDFTRFASDDARTTYEHIGQFLAQINDTGITDVHKVRLFPLSLSGTAFIWFTSLAPNSIDNWPTLESRDFTSTFIMDRLSLGCPTSRL
jgi:hypothetical protein